MIAGEFDLSVGSLVGFAGIIIGICVTIWGLPIWLAILISMALTTGLGVINGLIVVRTGLPSFIVTLATMFIIAGLSSVLTVELTNITFIPIEPDLIAADPLAAIFNWKLSFNFDGATSDLYVSVVWWIVIAADRRLRPRADPSSATGSPASAARRAAARNLGVPVARVKITLFAATAFSASILAGLQSMQFASADIQRGGGYELTAITMAVIGGCLLTGGYGSVAGTALGALALGMAQQGIVFAVDQRRLVPDRHRRRCSCSAVVLNNWIRRRFAGLR